MKKQQRIGIILLFYTFVFTLICITVIGFRTKSVQAASASISFSSDLESVAAGEEIKVTIQVDTDSVIGSIEGYIDYDSSILEYLTGASEISGGNGTLKLLDTITEEEKASKKYKMNFRAKKKGNCIIEFSEQPTVYEMETEDAMSVSYEDISIPVTKAKILSNNTKLDALRISPGTLEPSFAKNIKEYKAYVSADTEDIIVSAIPSDLEATVSVSGNDHLVEGENLVTVIVTAPSGKKKKYKIYVQRDIILSQEPEETQGENDEEQDNTTKKKKAATDKFNIQEKNGKITIKNGTSYTLVDLDDNSKIPSGYVKTRLYLYGVMVTAFTLEQDLENDFILMYARKKGEEPQFYQYDREEKTMQRFSGVTPMQSGGTKIVVGKDEKTLSVDEYNEKVQKLSIVVGISAALAVLFAFGLLNFAIKYFSLKAGKTDDF